MAPTAKQPPSEARRSKATDLPAPNGHDDRAKQDLGREQGDQRLHGERSEQGSRREPHRQPGDVQRTAVGSVGNQLQQPTGWLKPATATDALAPVFAAWERIFTSWFELARTMMKVQQQTFASMIGAGVATTNAERITNGDHPSRDHDALSASRTSSVAPDQIGHDRR